MDTLKSMQVFCAVVESGSFVKAADQLDISTAMASKHVAHLEKSLNTRLLHRTSRHVSLSISGEKYYPQCRQALDQLNYAADLASDEQAKPEGVLRISAPIWFGSHFFAVITHQFRQKYPDIKLDIHLNNRLVDLAEEGYDLSLRITEQPKDNDIAISICPVHFILVATPDLIRSLNINQIKNIEEIPAIMPSYINLHNVSLIVDHQKISFPNANIHFKSDNTMMLYQWALQSEGVAYLPAWLVENDIKTNKLEIVPIETDFPSNHLYAIYPHRRYINHKARSFVEFIKSVL